MRRSSYCSKEYYQDKTRSFLKQKGFDSSRGDDNPTLPSLNNEDTLSHVTGKAEVSASRGS